MHDLEAINSFENGNVNILLATDVIARGLDLDQVSHVINFDTPKYPENYMHRIGRTGRAEKEGRSILLFSEKEEVLKHSIEELMGREIPMLKLPEDVEVSHQKIPEERPEEQGFKSLHRNSKKKKIGASFHEKSEKNQKVNLGNSWKRDVAKKYKKPKTKGDKKQNLKKKR